MEGVLAQGDGIVADLNMPDGHVIDMPGFERNAFNPYAVYDAGHARRFQERTEPGLSTGNWTDIRRDEYDDAKEFLNIDVFSDRYRVLLGHGESYAVAFKRKQQRVELLYRITPGREVDNTEFHAVRTGTRFIDTFRSSDLHWRTGSAVTPWRDFAQYLQATYYLDLATAWRMAWASVRAAYLDQLPCLDALLEAAAKQNREKANTFDACLRPVITHLKRQSLT